MAQIDLQQIQYGKETVWGTSVAATAKAMDTLDIKIKGGVKSKVITTRAGSLGSGHLAFLESVRPTGSYKGVATYEDMLYWIESLFGIATPGGGPNYTRAYTAPTTAVPASPRLMSLYYGNTNDGVYKMLGTRATKFALSFASNKEVEYSVDFVGKSVATGTLAALSDRAVNVIGGNDLTIYLDTWAGTMGSSAFATTAYEGTLEIDTKRATLPYLGGIGPGVVSEPEWDATLKLRMEFNATSKALYEAMLNAGAGALFQKQVQLKFTTGASAIFQIGFAGSSEELPEIYDERDGMCAVEFALTRQYHTTFANWCKVDSTNAVSALP